MKQFTAFVLIVTACVLLASTGCVSTTSSDGQTHTWAGITTNGIGYKQTVVLTNGVTNSTGFKFTLPFNIGGAVQTLFMEGF